MMRKAFVLLVIAIVVAIWWFFFGSPKQRLHSIRIHAEIEDVERIYGGRPDEVYSFGKYQILDYYHPLYRFTVDPEQEKQTTAPCKLPGVYSTHRIVIDDSRKVVAFTELGESLGVTTEKGVQIGLGLCEWLEEQLKRNNKF